MSIKPTGYPSWCSSPSPTAIVEPLDSKKALGWQTTEKPRASYMNWLDEKTSAWIRYLSYDWLVKDDFVRRPSIQGGQGFTALGPGWDSASVSVGAAAVSAPYPGYGALAMLTAFAADNYASVWTRAESIPYGRDFILETAVAYGGPTGLQMSNGNFEVGLLFGQGPNNIVSFSTTGYSGARWWFNYRPSGAASATGINLGVSSVSPSGMQQLMFERRGATMLVEIDQVQVAVIAALPLEQGTSGYALFGAKAYSLDLAQTFVDNLGLGVRRR